MSYTVNSTFQKGIVDVPDLNEAFYECAILSDGLNIVISQAKYRLNDNGNEVYYFVQYRFNNNVLESRSYLRDEENAVWSEWQAQGGTEVNWNIENW